MDGEQATAALRFRDATEADVDAVVAVVESAYRGDASRVGWTTEADLLDGRRTDATAVREILAAGDVLLLAEDTDGALVGCCRLERRAAVAHFGLFAVDPRHQAAGVGRAVLAAAEQLARDRLGASEIEMTVIAQRAELIDWYERRGYRRTGDTRPFPYGDERFGLPRREDLYFVVLAKPLPTPGPDRRE